MERTRFAPKNTSVIIAAAVLLVILKFSIFSSEGLLGLYFFLGAIVVFIILSISTLLGIVRLIKYGGNRVKLSLIIVVLSLTIVFLNPVERIIENLKSPTVLFAFCEHSMFSDSLRLREDLKFEYQSGGFLKTNNYYGNYAIVNDTIFLNFNQEKPIDLNNKLIISEKFITEINETKKYNHKFEITINEIHK